MENLLPEPWLKDFASEIGTMPGGRPAVLRSPWLGPTLDLAAYRALLAGGLRPPYVAVLRDGTGVLPAEFTRVREVMGRSTAQVADPTALVELLEAGGTVLLPQLDHWHAGVADITRQLAALFQRRVDAFLFATMAGAQGLDVHRDDADVLVVQLLGVKSWQVHAGPDHDDWAPGPVSDPGPALLKTDLTAGECLYVPRGFAHAATGNSGLSLHLSFAIREVRSKHLLEALQELLTGDLPVQARPLTERSLTLTAEKLVQFVEERLRVVKPNDVLSLARESLLAQTSTHAVPRPPSLP
ncbi:cupin domain-containing protein (plasmid) [Streptomyces sp. NBC_00715]